MFHPARTTALLFSSVLISILAVSHTERLGAAGIPNDDASVRHALNRVTYGPRPGEVERVSRIGLGDWIDQQLHPSSIDDAALERLLPASPEAVRTGSPKEMRREAKRAVDDLAAVRLIRAASSERQPLQRLRRQGPHGYIPACLRAGRHSPACAGHVPRSARSDRQESRDALLSG